MESAPIDYFDHLLLKQAAPEWRKIARVVGDTISYNSETYWQVNELMLLTRIASLIDAGKLLADGDPSEMQTCHVRLPGR